MRCSVTGCENNNWSKKKKLSVSYFSFPKDVTIRGIWLNRCCNEKISEISHNTRICSDHFTPDDYSKDLRVELGLEATPKKSLKKNAIPSLNLPLPKFECETTSEESLFQSRLTSSKVFEEIREANENKILSNPLDLDIKYNIPLTVTNKCSVIGSNKDILTSQLQNFQELPFTCKNVPQERLQGIQSSIRDLPSFSKSNHCSRILSSSGSVISEPASHDSNVTHSNSKHIYSDNERTSIVTNPNSSYIETQCQFYSSQDKVIDCLEIKLKKTQKLLSNAKLQLIKKRTRIKGLVQDLRISNINSSQLKREVRRLHKVDHLNEKLKSILHKNFSPSQIKILTGRKKSSLGGK